MPQQPNVLYQDNHLLALYKPAGMLVQGDRTGDLSLVDWAKNYLKQTYNKPGDAFVGLPHRIDRPVSGLVLLCKTSKSLSRMNALFANRKITKTYLAVVQGQPASPTTTLNHYLLKNTRTNTVEVVTPNQPGAQNATTQMSLLSSHQKCSLVQATPITGRPHQIRVQLSAAGVPIVGDVKYNGPHGHNPKAIALHAHSLAFVHPVQNTPITLTAPLPTAGIWALFAQSVR